MVCKNIQTSDSPPLPFPIPPSYIRASFFRFLEKILLPFSSESRNITNSSRPQAAGTSAMREPTYACSRALALSSVAGSKITPPKRGGGSRGSATLGKRPCRQTWRFWKSRWRRHTDQTCGMGRQAVHGQLRTFNIVDQGFVRVIRAIREERKKWRGKEGWEGEAYLSCTSILELLLY